MEHSLNITVIKFSPDLVLVFTNFVLALMNMSGILNKLFMQLAKHTVMHNSET